MRRLWFARLIAAPVAGGLLIFWLHGAPSHYAPVNAGAFVLGLLAIHFIRLPRAVMHRRVLACGLLGLFALPLVIGTGLNGMNRWLPLGPVQLNSGALLLPLLTVIALRDSARGWLFLVTGLVIAVLQPDAASALALTLVLLVFAYVYSDWRALAVAAAGIPATWFAFAHGHLPPVPFVEGIIPMLWSELSRPIQAVGVGLLLLTPPLYFLHEKRLLRQDALSLAAVYCGLVGMSLIGPYPMPLVGYGPAAILGFMAAIAATPRRGQTGADEFSTMNDLVARENRILERLRKTLR